MSPLPKPQTGIDTTRCMAPHRSFGPLCQAPATHNSPLGRRCARHAEELREALRNPRALGNVMAGGRARTEEEIAKLVVGLPS